MMSDELDHLKELFRAEVAPVPRDEARKNALAAAMASFDERNMTPVQGSALGDRLSRWLTGLFKRSDQMSTLRLSHVLIAGSSLAVLGLVVVGSGLLRHAHEP